MPNATPTQLAAFLARLLSLPSELQAEIVGWVVATPRRLRADQFDQEMQSLSNIFAGHPVLMQLAEHQTLRVNNFATARLVYQPSPKVHEIRNLSLYFKITVSGGTLEPWTPATFALSAVDMAAFAALPTAFPRLNKLSIVVDNFGGVVPGAVYNMWGMQRFATSQPAGQAMERAERMLKFAKKATDLDFPVWNKDKPVRITLVFRHKAGLKYPCAGAVNPMDSNDPVQQAGLLHRMMDYPRAEIAIR